MRERMLAALDAFCGRKLVVAGDLIADEFLYGETSRISREAPVLVLQYRDLVRAPGGAANATNNLLDLGAKAALVSAVGADEAGAATLDTLAGKGADVSSVARVAGYPTPVKTRILAGAHHSAPQQIVRLDRIAALPPSFAHPPEAARAALAECDGIIVSDYGYGNVSPALFERLRETAVRRGVPIVVDSRFRMGWFHGVTALTPNITELEAATGRTIGDDTELLHRTGVEVLRKQKLRYLLVTQGRFGMTLLQRRASPVHIPIFGTDEVADVTGAGDTVIAVFSLALAAGAAAEEAARLANFAGGLVVMKRNTATITLAELRAAVAAEGS